MELLLFCLFLFISRVRSQALLSVLQNHFELSTFNSYVNGSQKLTNLLSSADNVTLLAPSNAAFKAWLPKQAPNLAEDQIEALLTYHLVHGVFPSVTFSDQPQFSKTFLNNITYTNVTGGQRAELSTGSSGNPEIVSGNKSVSGILTTVRSPDANMKRELTRMIGYTLHWRTNTNHRYRLDNTSQFCDLDHTGKLQVRQIFERVRCSVGVEAQRRDSHSVSFIQSSRSTAFASHNILHGVLPPL
jgi:uncharacterized surface protein with fasciclin (FAS1) repeats